MPDTRLDTHYYITEASDAELATINGLLSMGYSEDNLPNYEWVLTDTYGLINHGVPPATSVSCGQCHGRIDVETDSMLDQQGYRLKGPKQQICGQCHNQNKHVPRNVERMHQRHINEDVGCGFCHSFERPERELCSPCDPTCVQQFVCGPLCDHTDICH